MNEQILNLHALIQYLEAHGCWGSAQAFRSILNDIVKELRDEHASLAS